MKRDFVKEKRFSFDGGEVKKAGFYLSAFSVALFLFAFPAFPCGLGKSKRYKAQKTAVFMSPSMIIGAKDEVVEKVVKVEGMECDKCAKAVKAEIKKIDGVLDVEVDLDTGNCKVKYKKGKVKVEDIYKAIEKAGFKPVKGS